MPDALPARKRATLFDGLRNGQDVAAAAQAAGLDARAVFTAARTDTALALLLAGTDPDELGAAGLISVPSISGFSLWAALRASPHRSCWMGTCSLTADGIRIGHAWPLTGHGPCWASPRHGGLAQRPGRRIERLP